MDANKIQWVTELDGKLVAKENTDKRKAAKDAKLKWLREEILKHQKTIIEGQNVKATDGENEEQLVNFWLRDQRTEFDQDQMQDNYALNPEDFAKHLKVGQLITSMAKELESEQTDKLGPDGKPITTVDSEGKVVNEKEPLFSEGDLGADLFDPLVRRGFMAETQVPNEFSKTQAMVKGSFDEYKKRLDKEGTKSLFAENFSLGKTLITSSLSLVSFAGKLDELKEMKPTDPTWGQMVDGEGWERFVEEVSKKDAGHISELAGMGVELAASTYEEVDEDLSEESEPDKSPEEERDEKAELRAQQGPKVAELVISNVAAPLAAALNAGGLGTSAAATFATKVSTKTIAKAIGAKKVDESKVGTAIAALAAAYDATMKSIDPKIDDSTETLTAAASLMSGSLLGTNKAEIVEALAENDFVKVITLFSAAGDTAASVGTTPKLTTLLTTDSTVAAMKKGADETLTKTVVDEAETERAKLEKERQVIENGEDPEATAKLLEKKIAEMERNAKILKWSSTIAGMGFDLASKAIAPLAIGGSAIKLAQNIYQAAVRTQDTLTFCENRADLFRAASPYSAPVSNFIDNAAFQAWHYTVNAAFELVNMIGAIVACTGVGAIAGSAMQAAASATGAVEAVLYEIKKRVDLETAWKQYKLALSRPENRKLGLIAMQENPTLAKYAVAWGAVIKKDPLVSDFISSCGIDAVTLKDEKDTSKVVKYLELRMPDDNVVVGRQVASAEWAPKEIKLTLASWVNARTLGESQGDLKPGGTRDIESALASYDTLFTATESKVKAKNPQDPADPVSIVQCKTLLDTIEKAMTTYSPVHQSKTGLNREMIEVRDLFVACVPAQRGIVAKWG